MILAIAEFTEMPLVWIGGGLVGLILVIKVAREIKGAIDDFKPKPPFSERFASALDLKRVEEAVLTLTRDKTKKWGQCFNLIKRANERTNDACATLKKEVHVEGEARKTEILTAVADLKREMKDDLNKMGTKVDNAIQTSVENAAWIAAQSQRRE